jgi:tryptophan 2,3-dioxygenase
MARRNTNRVVTLFHRAHIAQRLLMEQLRLLETMSPKEYQTIRLGLGAGSGQESPGFRTLLKMAPFLWETYKTHYLDADNLTVEAVYDSAYDHGDAYVVAERLVEFDEMFQAFRFHHMQLIRRSIGIDAKSLKGRPVEILESGQRHQFFPELWAVRGRMTDAWGASYGVKRDSLGEGGGHH